jgi:hypothetical protein
LVVSVVIIIIVVVTPRVDSRPGVATAFPLSNR